VLPSKHLARHRGGLCSCMPQPAGKDDTIAPIPPRSLETRLNLPVSAQSLLVASLLGQRPPTQNGRVSPRVG
jgi:hypothetical protein